VTCLRKPSQRSVEIALAGPNNATDAETSVRAMLAKYIQINADKLKN
jgi:hypothetical protein